MSALLCVGGPKHAQTVDVDGPTLLVPIMTRDDRPAPAGFGDYDFTVGQYRIARYAMSDPTKTSDERKLVLGRKAQPKEIRWAEFDRHPERRQAWVLVWQELWGANAMPTDEAMDLLRDALMWRWLGETGEKYVWNGGRFVKGGES